MARKPVTKATKKVATKKVAAKRTYTRKPKTHVEVDIVVEQAAAPAEAKAEAAPPFQRIINAEQAAAFYDADVTTNEVLIITDDNLVEALTQVADTAYGRGYEQLTEYNKKSVERQRSEIEHAEFISLEGLPPKVRAALLLELDDMGYLSADGSDLFKPYDLSDFLTGDLLQLNHKSKLVRAVRTDKADDSKAVLRISVLRGEVFISSYLTDNKPARIEQDGVTYFRTGR